VLETKATAIAQTQRPTSLSLDSMLPAILDRAFSQGLDGERIAIRRADQDQVSANPL
jgi:hypothetical protein